MNHHGITYNVWCNRMHAHKSNGGTSNVCSTMLTFTAFVALIPGSDADRCSSGKSAAFTRKWWRVDVVLGMLWWGGEFQLECGAELKIAIKDGESGCEVVTFIQGNIVNVWKGDNTFGAQKHSFLKRSVLPDLNCREEIEEEMHRLTGDTSWEFNILFWEDFTYLFISWGKEMHEDKVMELLREVF